jgi:1-acyl-sn-glycerol-3-phosphate acyltransferase
MFYGHHFGHVSLLVLSILSGVDILIFKMARIWANSFFWYGFYYKIDEDREINTTQSYMIVANHTSMADIMLMLAITKNLLFLW